jgi:molybdopterin/thiamine biosynthesis adenylyltransferase
MNAAWSYEVAFSRHDGLLTAREQERLRLSRVAIIGMGGVGGVHLITLARLGIGKFTIGDPDRFEAANINRQYGARVDTLGRPKVDVMAEEVRRINPEVEVKTFGEAIRPETVGDFLAGADLFVDGIDFFSIGMRRVLFRRAAEKGIYAVTAGPLGFGTAWLTFAPQGMSFDQYFDLNDGQTELEQLVCFLVGLAPKALHRPYIDWSRVSLEEKKGPSAGLACQLCSGVVAAQAVRLLLDRGPIRAVPYYSQFDAYRGILRTRRLWLGNRHPLQLLKRSLVMRRFRGQLGTSHEVTLGDVPRNSSAKESRDSVLHR